MCGFRGDFRICCCCFPLAFASILGGCLYAAAGVQGLAVALTQDDILNWNPFIIIVLAILELGMGIMAIIAGCTSWRKGAAFVDAIYRILFICIIISVITMVIGCLVREYFTEAIAYSVVGLVEIALCYWVGSAFRSFSEVLDAGGTGWEKQNAEEIKATNGAMV